MHIWHGCDKTRDLPTTRILSVDELNCCVFSPIDIKRHVACEDCRSLVNGGFDPTTNQVRLHNSTIITLTIVYSVALLKAATVNLLNFIDQHSMTAALQQLHWLPVAYRIQFKLLTLVHGAIHANTPRYLADRVSAYVPSRSLRSTDQSLLVVPRVNLERFGRRAFSCAGPSLWNALPLVLRTEQDVERFRRDLKTYLFKQAFM